VVQRYTGTDTLQTIANGSRITLTSAVPQRGPKGDDGVKGDIVWRGSWSAGSYEINDTVENKGSTYVAISNTSEEPSISSTDWELVAQKGDIGPTGSGSNITTLLDDVVISGSPFSKLNFSSDFDLEQDSVDSTQVNINLERTTGTSFPGSPFDGQRFYRTDESWWYTYDLSRSKWLGEIEWDGSGVNGNVSNNTYFKRFNGMIMSATEGIYIPYDITIVGISLANNNSVSGDVQVMRDGATTGAVLSLSNETGAGDMSVNVDFLKDAVMAMRWGNTTFTLNDPQVRVWWRRKGT
jgi:hypothetical protein